MKNNMKIHGKLHKVLHSRYFSVAFGIVMELLLLLTAFTLAFKYLVPITVLGILLQTGVLLYVINRDEIPEFKIPWIFVDLLSDKEVADMTMAQFSRDDILIYQGREEGKEEGERIGEIKGVICTHKKFGATHENTRRYIMEEYQKSEGEADELMKIYW